jgi:hypothetical protein
MKPAKLILNLYRHRRICASIVLLIAFTSGADAADYSIRPTIAVSEEATDNVFEVKTNKRKEFITRVQPGFALKYKTPVWYWDSAYNFDFRHYARQSRGDETTHNLTATGLITIIDNFMFLDVRDTYRRVSLDVTRDVANESLFVNQTDQNRATVSPYLLWRLGGKSTLKTGYLYTDTRYWDSAGIDKGEHRFFADLNHELTSKLSLSAGYAFTRGEALPSQFDKHDLSGGFRYEYADESFIFGSIGNSWQSFSSGSNVSNLFWNAGVTSDLGIALATLETRVQYTEDPLTTSTKETSYSGKLDKVLQRGSVGLSGAYSEYAITERGERDRRKLSFAGTGRHEVLPGLTATLAATAERFSRKTVAEYPYRFTGIGSLNFTLNYDVTVGLTYTYVTYRYALDSASNATEINRAIMEVRKTF